VVSRPPLPSFLFHATPASGPGGSLCSCPCIRGWRCNPQAAQEFQSSRPGLLPWAPALGSCLFSCVLSVMVYPSGCPRVSEPALRSCSVSFLSLPVFVSGTSGCQGAPDPLPCAHALCSCPVFLCVLLVVVYPQAAKEFQTELKEATKEGAEVTADPSADAQKWQRRRPRPSRRQGMHQAMKATQRRRVGPTATALLSSGSWVPP